MLFLLLASKLYVKLGTAFVGYICVYSFLPGTTAFFFLRQKQFIAMESEYQRKFVQKRMIIMY